MQSNTHARLGRPLANVLTVALSALGAWGWAMDATTPLAPRIALIVISLVAQQLANVAGAAMAQAVAQMRPVLVAASIVMLCLFAMVAGHGIEHAMEVVETARVRADVEQREPERAQVMLEIGRIEGEKHEAETAIRSISSDLPSRRIATLQQPLADAIARADQRLTLLRHDLETMSRAPSRSAAEEEQARLIRLLFWALAFGEPLAYFVLAALGTQSRRRVPSVPATVPPANVPTSEPSSRRKWWLRLAPIATIVAGAMTPQSAAAAPADFTRAETETGTGASWHTEDVERAVPAGDTLLRQQALTLAAQGLSVRKIAAQLGGRSKSTFARWIRADRGV